MPTPRGPIQINWNNDSLFQLSLKLPLGMHAKLELPALTESRGVFNGVQSLVAHRVGSRWVLDEDVSGTVNLEVK